VRWLLAFLLLTACEKAEDHHHPRPAPRDARSADAHAADAAPIDTHFTIRYAARTDEPVSGINTSYFSIVEDEAFFIVADGTADSSKRLAERASTLIAKDCHATDDEQELRCALDRANAELATHHETASFAAVVVRGNQALLAAAGQIPIAWRHGGTTELIVLTAPQLRWIDLHRGDTLFVVTAPTLAALGADAFATLAPAGEVDKHEVEAVIKRLTDSAMSRRGPHDAITAIAIHLVHPKD
jgi:hypothetical protein